MIRVAGMFVGGIAAGALLVAAASNARPQAGRAWTGLVYSSDAPPSGTAARELFDGKDSLRSNMPATAKDQLLAAIRLDPSLAEAHFWLAGAYRKLKDGPAARRSLAIAIRLDPMLAAHARELDRFGADVGGGPAPAPGGAAGRCDALYSTCMVSATQCTTTGCRTDAGRQASCTGERNQCLARAGAR